ncbi:MAG: GWxTD domain-containing protein [bacterium]|nr:GWxTD domain-containing protein [bacterium]
MVRYKIFLICLILMVTISGHYFAIHAQTAEETTMAPEQFNFGFDVGLFRAQDDFVLVEIYYSLFRNYLKFVPDENRWRAEFSLTAEIFANDTLLASDQWQNLDFVDSLSQITPGQKLFGMGYFAVKPGDYLLKLTLRDHTAQIEKQRERLVSITPFAENKIALSDIELATQIKPSQEKTRFFKNGYNIIPNPDQFYGTGLPMLMFYTEIYNLTQEADPDTGSYSVQYRILDGDLQAVREFPVKIRNKPGESAVEVSGMNIISFRSGTYFLEIDVKDLTNGESVSRQKKFFIFREGDLAMSDSASQKLAADKLKASLERIYSNMDAASIDEEFDATQYISTSDEKKIYKTLDTQGKQAFLLEFWKKRDTSPETPQNEFRDNYLKLMNTANKEFTGFKKGYKSDRGRVLLIYGVPDEIERIPMSMEAKAHHIWKYYSVQGGVNFYFVDKQGFGDFELVNSTARGELNDPDWERWIDPNR